MDVFKAFEDYRTETEKKVADEIAANNEKVKTAKTAVEDELPDEKGNTTVKQETTIEGGTPSESGKTTIEGGTPSESGESNGIQL